MDYQVKICQKAEKTYYMEEIPPQIPKESIII